jgi:hypothetical protein
LHKPKATLLRKIVSAGILFSLLCTGVNILHAQNFPERVWWTPGAGSYFSIADTLRPVDTLNLNFEHTLSLYTWTSQLRLSSSAFITGNALTPTVSIIADGLSRLRQDTRIRTSDGSAFITSDYPLDAQHDGLTLALFGSKYSLSTPSGQTEAAIGTLTSVTDGYGVLGGKYFFSPLIEVAAGGGIAQKSFEIGSGSGWIFQGKLLDSATQLSEGNMLDLKTFVDERHFSLADEVARNDNVRAHLLTNFSGSGYNDASGVMYLKRQDFFFPKDTSGTLAKQERSDLGFELHDALYLPIIPRHLIGNFRVDLSPHEVTRRTPSVDITTLPTTTLVTSTFLVPSTTSALQSALSGKLDLLVGDNSDTTRLGIFSVEMKYDERNETNTILQGETGSLSPLTVSQLSNAIGQTSFDGKQTTLNLSASVPLAERDVLHADLSSRIYRYDTPNPDNHDDRDELNIASSLKYTHYFSPQLQLTNELQLAKSHLVYLESDHSSQNFAGKTISFSSQAAYYSPSFQHQVRGEVFANYAVYDFPIPVTDPNEIRDYLIRGVNGSDSIRISIGRFHVIWDALSQIEGIFDLRLYERGAYNQSAFTERPVLRTSQLSGDLTLNLTDRISPSPALVKIGVRAFYLRQYSPIGNSLATTLPIQEKLNRIGPLLIVIIDQFASTGPKLYGSIWYSFVNQENDDTSTFSSSHQIEARLSTQWTF